MEENKIYINWFPGHMTRALRQMEKSIKDVDIIFYCLDSRAPFSCLNPKLTKLASNKFIIYVLTKADLVNSSDLNTFKAKLKSNNSTAVFVNSTQTNSSKIVYESAKELLKEKFEKASIKGLNFTIKAMVVGVPNCGKSTLINNFCGKSKAITGNKPGVTKGQQWLVSKDEKVQLLDTPGTLWPSFKNFKTAKNLAYIGSIKDEVLDITNLAFEFIKDMIEKDKSILENRYNIVINETEPVLEVFDDICKSRGCLEKGGDFDYEKCAKIIIDDFRKNRLGKIILD